MPTISKINRVKNSKNKPIMKLRGLNSTVILWIPEGTNTALPSTCAL